MTREEKNKILADKNSASTTATTTASTVKGSNAELDKVINSDFAASDAQTKAQGKVNNQSLLTENLLNQDKIISNKTQSAINSKFKTPTAVTEADAYLKGQLSKIQGGKTSYADQITNLMSQITNRDKFSYDVDNDPLFQQALASAMNSGKSAMQDTIGQVSALTGGYGSSFATTAGNQAYNAYIEDAYNNLPQYYQMALDAYNAEGDEMYRQLGMYQTADETEYNRMLNAYDATGAYRDRLYNEAYQQFRDNKSDAFASANLQLNEYGQKVNNALALQELYTSEADKLYEREYQQWSDEVNKAMQYAQMLNSDYWKQTQLDEEIRQFEQSFAEEQRQFDEKLAFEGEWNQKNFDEGVRQFDTKLENDNIWKGKELDYQNAVLNNSIYEFAVTHGDTNGDGKLDASEIAAWSKALMKPSGSGGTGTTKGGTGNGLGLTNTEYDKFINLLETKGEDDAFDYLDLIGKAPASEEQENIIAGLVNKYSGKTEEPTSVKTGTISDFQTKKGKNFTIDVDGTEYEVETGDQVDSKTKAELDKMGVEEDTAFVYNGGVYVKYAGGYFKVEGRMLSKAGYKDALAALK